MNMEVARTEDQQTATSTMQPNLEKKRKRFRLLASEKEKRTPGSLLISAGVNDCQCQFKSKNYLQHCLSKLDATSFVESHLELSLI